MGFSDMGNTNITIKISYDVLLRVYASILRKNTYLSQYLEIGYVGVLRRQEHEYSPHKFSQYNIKGQEIKKKQRNLFFLEKLICGPLISY